MIQDIYESREWSKVVTILERYIMIKPSVVVLGLRARLTKEGLSECQWYHIYIKERQYV